MANKEPGYVYILTNPCYRADWVKIGKSRRPRWGDRVYGSENRPVVKEKLAANGSPRATFETTEDRLTFLIHIPVHIGCGSKPVSGTDEEVSPVTTEKTTEKSNKTTGATTEKTTEKIIRLMRENPQITNLSL